MNQYTDADNRLREKIVVRLLMQGWERERRRPLKRYIEPLPDNLIPPWFHVKNGLYVPRHERS